MGYLATGVRIYTMHQVRVDNGSYVVQISTRRKISPANRVRTTSHIQLRFINKGSSRVHLKLIDTDKLSIQINSVQLVNPSLPSHTITSKCIIWP